MRAPEDSLLADLPMYSALAVPTDTRPDELFLSGTMTLCVPLSETRAAIAIAAISPMATRPAGIANNANPRGRFHLNRRLIMTRGPSFSGSKNHQSSTVDLRLPARWEGHLSASHPKGQPARRVGAACARYTRSLHTTSLFRRLSLASGKRGRCNRPAPRAIVGWGFISW